MRTFALLAAIAVADMKDDFPADDATHADCHLTAYFDALGCEQMYNAMSYKISFWNTPETSPAGGEYHFYSGSAYDYIWTTRTTRDK